MCGGRSIKNEESYETSLILATLALVSLKKNRTSLDALSEHNVLGTKIAVFIRTKFPKLQIYSSWPQLKKKETKFFYR